MGTIPEAMEIKRPVKDKKSSPALTLGVPAEWCRLSRIWYDRAMYSRKNRNKSYYFLLNVGRWLGKVHPEIISQPIGRGSSLPKPYLLFVSGMAAIGAASIRSM
jgi:hypothetical protein